MRVSTMLVWPVLAALIWGTPALAGMPGSMSGTWYNPTQSGHGLSLDVLSAGRAVAIWHVFDTEGQPVTLYIDGELDGRQLSGPAYAPIGMRFGRFDPAELQLPVWGQVSIVFSSCDHAQLSWHSTQAGFADGQMPLTRLAQTADQDCQLPVENALTSGLYVGEMQASVSRPSTNLEGIVDREGRLWGFERGLQETGAALSIPGPMWVGAYAPRIFRIEPLAVSASAISARSAMYTAHALWLPQSGDIGSAEGSWQLAAVGGTQGDFASTSANAGAQRWRPGAAVGRTLVAPISLSELQGQYEMMIRAQFFAFQIIITIGADGSLCIPAGFPSDPSACRLLGTLSTPEGQAGLIEFSAADQARPELGRYLGRGWLAETTAGRELILVGDNGTLGLLVVANRR